MSDGLDEQTGPHPRIAASVGDGLVRVNLKFWAPVLAAFVGAGGLGAGATYLRPAVPESVVQSIDDARRTSEEVKTLGRGLEAQLAEVRLTLVKIQAGIDQRAEQSRANASMLSDHEQRLRALERRGR